MTDLPPGVTRAEFRAALRDMEHELGIPLVEGSAFDTHARLVAVLSMLVVLLLIALAWLGVALAIFWSPWGLLVTLLGVPACFATVIALDSTLEPTEGGGGQ